MDETQEPTLTLYYLLDPKCAMCRKQKPHVEAFAAEHPGVKLVALPVEREDRAPGDLDVEFPVTRVPSFALRIEGHPKVVLREGPIGTAVAIRRWVLKVLRERKIDVPPGV